MPIVDMWIIIWALTLLGEFCLMWNLLSIIDTLKEIYATITFHFNFKNKSDKSVNT